MQEQLEKHQKFNELMEKTPDELKVMGLNYIQDHYGYLGVSAVTYNKWRRQWEDRNRTPETDVEEAVKELSDMALGKATPNMAKIKSIELLLKRNRELNGKENVKDEFTASDRINQSIKLREELRREFEITGSCPCCGFSKILRIQPCMDSKPEHAEDSQVATLELSARTA
jgi:hypothetical protein